MAPSLSPEATSLPPEFQPLLLELAMASIRHGLGGGGPLPVAPETLPEALRERRATFATLRLRGQLRGCIGSLKATLPLAEDAVVNAHAAAFQDWRFPPVSEAEVDHLDLHLAILSPPEPLPCASEAELLAQLVPGRDGLILACGPRRATFLPAVWETLPAPRDFVDELLAKAGLFGWPKGLKAYRYTAQSIP